MKKFFENFNLLGFMMLCLCVVLGVGDVAGAMYADAAPLTPSGTGEAKTFEPKSGGLTDFDIRYHQNQNIADLIKDPVDQKIVQIRPYANPIDTLLRYAGADDSINNMEFGWYSIGTRPVYDKTTAAATMHPSATKKSVYGTVTVTDASLFDVTDTVSVTATNGSELQLYIYKKDSANGLYFTVREEDLVADTQTPSAFTIPAFGGTGTSASTLYIMGRSAAQKDVTSPAMTVLPEKSKGYCQIFMTEIEQNTYEKMADKEVKWDMSEVEENILFEYRRRMEGTWLRGKGGKVYDPEKGVYVYNATGLINQINKTYTVHAGAADGNAEIVDLHKSVFVGNNGAKIRYALCGSEALALMSKLNGIVKKQEAVQTEVVFGITWSKSVTNFGQINMIHHEMMDDYGMSDKMLIIDPAFIKMKRVMGFERNEVDGKAHLITNGDIVVYSETCGLAVYNPDVHSIVTVSSAAS